MLVVSDTTPLNYLVLIGHVDVLPKLFDQVVTSPAVLSEMSQAGAPTTMRSWAASPPAWLGLQRPKAIDLRLELGPGELEAICLAREIVADAVLIDERKGAQAAMSLGLAVTGTLGVLLLAHERGAVDLEVAFDSLKQTSFRAAPGLYERLLRESRRNRGSE